MNRQTGVWLGTALSLLLASAAQAALLERLDGQAYYDTDLDITWLADANLAASEDFDVSGINANGWMTWDKAKEPLIYPPDLVHHWPTEGGLDEAEDTGWV